jgi:predicted ribosomally synthesized peptide with nif11-like leader
MSQADAKSFVERAANDDELRRDVMGELSHLAESTPKRLVKLGASNGLSFTETELAEALSAPRGGAVEELSDTDLAAVTGGSLPRIQVTTAVYNAWMAALKATADSKGQIQGELARFR